MPEIDDNETWKLLQASENGTHTKLKVGRLLNTCDSQDVAIGVSFWVTFPKRFVFKYFFVISSPSCCRTVPIILFGQWVRTMSSHIMVIKEEHLLT